MASSRNIQNSESCLALPSTYSNQFSYQVILLRQSHSLSLVCLAGFFIFSGLSGRSCGFFSPARPSKLHENEKNQEQNDCQSSSLSDQTTNTLSSSYNFQSVWNLLYLESQAMSTLTRILHKADFDVDKHLNPLVPPPPAPHRLPAPLARLLGLHRTPPKPLPDLLRAFWVLLATFTGVIVVTCTLKYGKPFKDRDCPVFIPSWVSNY